MLTMVPPLAVDWTDLQTDRPYTGKVTRLETFGAFVNIGAERDQLVDECSCGGRHPLPLCSRAGGPSSAASHMAVRPRSFAHDPSLRAH